MDNKRFGKLILILGIASVLSGIGLGIYIEMFSISTYSNTIPANTVPTWFAFLIAAVFAILGMVLIHLGAMELDYHYLDSDAKT